MSYRFLEEDGQGVVDRVSLWERLRQELRGQIHIRSAAAILPPAHRAGTWNNTTAMENWSENSAEVGKVKMHSKCEVDFNYITLWISN